MHIRHLEQFVVVTERGSLGAASRSFGLSQPAVTHNMQALEHALGSRLLIRSSALSARVRLQPTNLRPPSRYVARLTSGLASARCACSAYVRNVVRLLERGMWFVLAMCML
jgi:hypothetical protein